MVIDLTQNDSRHERALTLDFIKQHIFCYSIEFVNRYEHALNEILLRNQCTI